MTFTFKTTDLLPSADRCGECQELLRQGFSALPGVTSSHVDGQEVRLEAVLNPQAGFGQVLKDIERSHAHATFKVEGMDCANCTRTVEGALGKIPGVSAFQLNYIAEKMAVAYNPQQASLHDFKSGIEPHGYKVSALPSQGPSMVKPSLPLAPTPWYRTPQARPVLLSGMLLALAWWVGLLEPRWAFWGFTLATVVGVWPFTLKAYRGLWVGNPFSINLLVSVAALGAIVIGEAAEGAVVVFLFAVGEWLEGVAAGQARAGIRALAALAPKTALLYHSQGPSGAHTHPVPIESLEVGQTILVEPGGRVAADGTVLGGQSAVDESPITGESVPVTKGIGDPVFAGSINSDAALTVRVDKTAQDNTIARIIHLVEEAQHAKAPTERFIDRFSRAYTPAVMVVALLAMVLPPLLMGGVWLEWIYKGLALLLIGCPCALLISVPAAVSSAIAAGTRRGLLVKGGAALETLGSVATVAFDKTGTLTEGRPQVTKVMGWGLPEATVLGLAAAVEQGSSHPLAKAIVTHAQQHKVTVPASSQQKALQGKAVTAVIDSQTYSLGSPRYAQEVSVLGTDWQAQIASLEQEGQTVAVLIQNTQPVGLIALRDEPRPDSKEAIAQLKQLGIHPVMLTGDNVHTGQAIARQLGLEVSAELLPQDKLLRIDQLKSRGKVAMVGDGINDAPALAKADVGIAMGSGTEVALETADAALLRNSPRGVAELIGLSRATLSNIHTNIAIALGLKTLFLITTLLGVTNLWMAILADTGATVLVTANALRLLRYGRKLP